MSFSLFFPFLLIIHDMSVYNLVQQNCKPSYTTVTVYLFSFSWWLALNYQLTEISTWSRLCYLFYLSLSVATFLLLSGIHTAIINTLQSFTLMSWMYCGTGESFIHLVWGMQVCGGGCVCVPESDKMFFEQFQNIMAIFLKKMTRYSSGTLTALPV